MPAFQDLLGCSRGGVLNRLIVALGAVRRPNAVAFFPVSLSGVHAGSQLREALSRFTRDTSKWAKR
jgi:hypothetical protein